MFSDAEMPSFHLFLGSDDGTGELLLGEFKVFKILLSQQHGSHSLDPLSSHLAHDEVIESDEEYGNSRIALPTGTSSELIVDPPGFVFFGSEDEKPVMEILFDGFRGGCVGRPE